MKNGIWDKGGTDSLREGLLLDPLIESEDDRPSPRLRSADKVNSLLRDD